MGRKKIIHYLCKCGQPVRSPSSGYCRNCGNAYQTANRKRHSELTPESRARANARSYLNVYIRRGKIKKQPCLFCGNPEAEAHHHDYSKPLEVTWLCKEHHLLNHEAY